MSFKHFLLVLRARWLVGAGIFWAVVIAVMGYTLLQPSQYTASASVVVDAKTDPIAGVVYSAEVTTGVIATQVDIIGSERVAQRVVKTIKLDPMPEFVKVCRS